MSAPSPALRTLSAGAFGTAGAAPAPQPRIVIAGAGPAAQAFVEELTRAPFAGAVTVLSNRDDAPAAWLDLAAMPAVSVRFGQPVSHIDAENRCVTTADGLEFGYDALVIATGSAPAAAPVAGAGRCLTYATIDDALRLGTAVAGLGRALGRRPLAILVGTGTAAGQAEAVLRASGVRPVRTTVRPAGILPAASSPAASSPAAALPAGAGFAGPGPVAEHGTGIVFDDGSSMTGDVVVLAEERAPRDGLAAGAGLVTAPRGGIAVDQGFRTSVPGIWALGDAAAYDGVRLGLLLAAGPAAARCAAQLRRSAPAGLPAGAA